MCCCCHQWNVTRPLLSYPVRLSVTFFLNNKLQSCCSGASRHQTVSIQRYALLGQCFSLYIVHRKEIGQNVLVWRSFIVVLCLQNLAPGYYKRRSFIWVNTFHLWGKQYTFLRWRRIKTDWLRELWRDLPACVDGGRVLNTLKGNTATCSHLWDYLWKWPLDIELINNSLLTSCGRWRWNFSAQFKEDKSRRGWKLIVLTPHHPHSS